MTQVVKNPPAMQKTWVQPLDWENPLEKGTATYSRILAWRIPWTVCKPMGSQRVRHNWATFTSSTRAKTREERRPPAQAQESLPGVLTAHRAAHARTWGNPQEARTTGTGEHHAEAASSSPRWDEAAPQLWGTNAMWQQVQVSKDKVQI